jgi:hypothetical protein
MRTASEADVECHLVRQPAHRARSSTTSSRLRPRRGECVVDPDGFGVVDGAAHHAAAFQSLQDRPQRPLGDRLAETAQLVEPLRRVAALADDRRPTICRRSVPVRRGPKFRADTRFRSGQYPRVYQQRSEYLLVDLSRQWYHLDTRYVHQTVAAATAWRGSAASPKLACSSPVSHGPWPLPRRPRRTGFSRPAVYAAGSFSPSDHDNTNGVITES